ncbi:MAG: SurA N-terminal domain-containing protein [Henriciella sp.]|nr:SurA N-terminal domain-containing protein [Henriciella sp.]
MFKSLMASAAILSTTLTASLATAQEGQQIEGIVAIVNDDPISYTDVRQRARMLLLSLGGREPTQQEIQQITAQALEQLIDEKLQLQEATEFEVEVSDEDIQNSLENLAQQSGITREVLMNSMLEAGINPASLEEQTRADIAWRRIMGGLYGSRIRISQNQIQEELAQLRAAAQKEQFLMSEIFLYAPTPDEQEQALVAANSIREQIEAGAPFEVAAQRFSSAPTAATGGDMGWVVLEDLDEVRASIVKQLDGPGLTQAITADDGIYLIQIRNKRSPAEQTSVVDLTRVTVADGSEAALQAAADEIEDCDDISNVVDADDNLSAAELNDLNINDLGPEGKEMVTATAIGEHTDIFAMSGTIAVMFVCDRQDNVDNIPGPEAIENRLYSQQLGMISDRSLRNLRREATIIRR